MTAQQKTFNYYCLDRCKPYTNEFTITYNDGSIIRKKLFKIGLRTNIKHIDSFCLYTETDQDFDAFMFIPTELFYDNQWKFFQEVLTIDELKSLITTIKTINIFQYLSLLEFTNIYQDFKEFVESNWLYLNMDDLIEI